VLGEIIDELISIHFGRFKVLEDYVGDLIRTQVEICKAHAQEAVKMALDMETTPHYTQNTRYFQLLREEWLAHYKKVRVNPSQYRNQAREDRNFPSEALHLGAELVAEALSYNMSMKSTRPFTMAETPETNALRAFAEAGHPNFWAPDLTRPDSYEEELIVMADVRAYYHIAYKRVIDNIPLTIEHGLHRNLAKQFSTSLFTNLLIEAASGPNFSERMRALLGEDASISEKRKTVSARKKRLTDIRRRLMTFSSH